MTESAGGIRMADFIKAPMRLAGERSICYRHILGLPASEHELANWQSQHPSHPLPKDLQELVLRVNGIHLWANTATGRSYTGIAPIQEWEHARQKMYELGNRDLLDGRYIAISYHQDGAAFVVLDVELEAYFLMDAAGPDATLRVGKNVPELLDWLWQNRIEPS
ncbi:MAG TPA: hypothetical protein PK156_28955 [Polyangium sp.]|nr:hypothetical protein [Polyangium sp.]